MRRDPIVGWSIERAKGIIMKRSGLGEAEAFRRLQTMASARRRKLVEIAGMIVLAEEACDSARLAGTEPIGERGPG
jgi:hypothetical protein